MTGIPHIEIKESAEDLKQLMKKQTSSLGFAKVQSLYLLKIKAVETVRYLAILMGRGESRIHRWLKAYREKGIKGLLNEEEEEYEEENSKPPGRPEVIDVETAASIYQELKEEEGFTSYQEVRVWLDLVKGLKFSYITVWRICHEELKAKLKVPRPKSTKQEKGAIERFKQELPERLTDIRLRIKKEIGNQTKIRYWCGDETR
jgi:transposase